jgi:high affinity Mn2+ porin
VKSCPFRVRGSRHDSCYALSESWRNPLSLFDELPRRRLEIRFGKFSIVDFLDQSAVGSDTHFQFTNWTIDNNGAYENDYAACDVRASDVG